MQLQAQGRLKLTCLISHTFEAQQAAQALRLLDEHTADVVQVVLEF